jgi:hypothetical protein
VVLDRLCNERLERICIVLCSNVNLAVRLLHNVKRERLWEGIVAIITDMPNVWLTIYVCPDATINSMSEFRCFELFGGI